MSSKRDVSDEQNERHKKVLDRLLKEEGNKYCVDCGMRSPTWASVNLGVFMCMTCSGIHRSLGVHISQVRSTKLDTWLPKQVEFISRMGNIKGNKYWEAQLPPGYRRPPGVAPNPELQKFIRNKYCDAMFVAKDVPAPGIDNYMSHPYVLADTPDTPAQHAEPAKPVPVVNIPMPVKLPQKPAVPMPSAAVSAKAPAASVVDVDLLGMDPTPPAAAPQAAATAADDPFGDFTAAPLAAQVASSANTLAFSDPFGDSAAFAPATPVFAAAAPSASVTSPTAAVASINSAATAATAKAAPSKPVDPFAVLVGDDLISNMQQVSLQPAQPAASKPAAAPAAKTSAADILKLYDTPQAATYDPFLGALPGDNAAAAQFGGIPAANGFTAVATGFQQPAAAFPQPVAGFQQPAFPAMPAQQYVFAPVMQQMPGMGAMPGMTAMPAMPGMFAGQMGAPHAPVQQFATPAYSSNPQYKTPGAAAANAFSGLTW